MNNIYTNMTNMLTYRKLNALLVFLSVSAMSIAYFFMQKHLALEACPLCIFQRLGLIGMGVFSLIALVINAQSTIIRSILWFASLLSVLWSLVVAGRHVWLQHLPADQVPSCGPGLNYWLDVLPLTQVLTEVFKGSGECAEISWKFLGLTIPEQTLLLFTLLTILHILLLKVIVQKSMTKK